MAERHGTDAWETYGVTMIRSRMEAARDSDAPGEIRHPLAEDDMTRLLLVAETVQNLLDTRWDNRVGINRPRSDEAAAFGMVELAMMNLRPTAAHAERVVA